YSKRRQKEFAGIISQKSRTHQSDQQMPLKKTEPKENLQEILENIVKQDGISSVCKLCHLNNFVKLLCSVGIAEDKLGFTYEEIIICLRLTLLNEAREVRVAGLQSFRYLIRDSNVLGKVLLLQVDYLIARFIDIQKNDSERTQALRLARKMISVNALLFPSSVTNSLIAVGNNGKQAHDQMTRACIAIICELSFKNPVLVAQRGGLSTILRNVTSCQLSRINEALMTTILHLLNHPHTRQYIRVDVELEQILAPYTDFHYQNPAEEEERDDQFTASKMSLVASFCSWSGIINLCKSGNSGIQSLIGLLCIPNMEVRKGLLEVLFEIFQLTLPRASADFHEALTSTDSGRFKDNWRLSDGFVASEAKTVLPQRSGSRPDLMDNYLALLLSAFIKTGLFEALVDVITSSTDVISIWATILLGELLHMANTILPHSQSHHLYCLPSLVNMAACCDYPPEKRLRASAAVNDLKDFHQRKKRGIKPTSLFLDHILRTAVESQGCKDTHSKTPKDIVIIKDYEDSLLSLVRDSHVLSHRETMDWNWHHIETILKWPHVSLRGNELMHKFVQRLVFFYKPSLQLYSDLEVEHPKGRQLTVVGCQFVEFLLASEEDGQMYLEDLVRDIVHYLFFSAGHKDQLSSRLLVTLSQNYFLFLGILSAHPHGVRLLEKGRVFQWWVASSKCYDIMHVLKNTSALYLSCTLGWFIKALEKKVSGNPEEEPCISFWPPEDDLERHLEEKGGLLEVAPTAESFLESY
uniref:Rapamycin-insensitive companion of mTOR-like n=1 Tax=Gouania willdenowi TaxID=441366 RepID=A0A8C5GMU5_GOUWI